MAALQRDLCWQYGITTAGKWQGLPWKMIPTHDSQSEYFQVNEHASKACHMRLAFTLKITEGNNRPLINNWKMNFTEFLYRITWWGNSYQLKDKYSFILDSRYHNCWWPDAEMGHCVKNTSMLKDHSYFDILPINISTLNKVYSTSNKVLSTSSCWNGLPQCIVNWVISFIKSLMVSKNFVTSLFWANVFQCVSLKSPLWTMILRTHEDCFYSSFKLENVCW